MKNFRFEFKNLVLKFSVVLFAAGCVAALNGFDSCNVVYANKGDTEKVNKKNNGEEDEETKAYNASSYVEDDNIDGEKLSVNTVSELKILDLFKDACKSLGEYIEGGCDDVAPEIFKHFRFVNSYFRYIIKKNGLKWESGLDDNEKFRFYTKFHVFYCILSNEYLENVLLKMFEMPEGSIELGSGVRSVLRDFLEIPMTYFQLPDTSSLLGKYRDKISKFLCLY